MERNGGGGVTAGKGKKHELVKQLRFPPGFHFVPSEEELVDVYLRAKIEDRELPLQVVNHVDILDWEPGKLVEEYKGFGENKWYFFTQTETNEKNEPKRKLRPVAGVKATWKSTGSLTPIHRIGKDGKPEEEVIGTKRILIYQADEGDVDDDGKWSMHEYAMEEKPKMDQFVLCTIQRKLHWDKAGEGVDRGNKRKRGKGTNVEPAKTVRRKKTTTSQAQSREGQQQQQETTSDGSVEPLMHEQGHQGFRVEQPSAFDATSLSAAVPQGYPDGNHHQLGASAQRYAGYAHMAPNLQYSDMVQVHTQDPVMFYDQGQQLLSCTDHQLISPISSGEHAAQHQFCRQELEPLLPYPRPLENANLYSDSTYDGRIHSDTSTLVQQSTDDFLKFTDVHDDLDVGSEPHRSGALPGRTTPLPYEWCGAAPHHSPNGAAPHRTTRWWAPRVKCPLGRRSLPSRHPAESRP